MQQEELTFQPRISILTTTLSTVYLLKRMIESMNKQQCLASLLVQGVLHVLNLSARMQPSMRLSMIHPQGDFLLFGSIIDGSYLWLEVLEHHTNSSKQ